MLSCMSLPSDATGKSGADPLIGTVVSDRYRIDELLGSGAMGRVYKAEHVLIRKRLALKVLHRELASSPDLVARSEREAMAAANIEHPNVASATDFGKLEDGSVFLALEFVEGKSLLDLMQLGTMPAERALHITRQIASALAAAHELNIVHRDVKPDNVMLMDKAGDPDFVKVLDFGVAKVPIGDMGGGDGHPVTQVGTVFGTPEYMAPEQALGSPVDPRADLYALGVVLYQMLSGMHPFDQESGLGILSQQLTKPAPPFSERAPNVSVPPRVEEVVLRLLAKDVDQRFQTADEVVTAIEQIFAESVERDRLRTLPDGTTPGAVTAPLGGPATQIIGSPDPNAAVPSAPIPGAIAPSGAAHVVAVPTSALPAPPGSSGQPGTLLGVGAPGAPFSAGTGLDEAAYLPSSAGDKVRALLSSLADRQKSLPAPLGELPPAALLAALAVAVLVVLIGVVAIIRAIASPGSSEITMAVVNPNRTGSVAQPSVGPPSAIDKKIADAASEGTSALEALAELHPKNTKILVELVRAQRNDKSYADAVGTIRRALEIDPTRQSEKQFASTLWLAVQEKNTREIAYDTLKGPMKAKGADIIYDLATTKGVPTTLRKRAEKWLRSKEFDRNSSAGLHALVSLRYATSCRQRYALLPRVKVQGDHRALALLLELKKTTGCGPGEKRDCNPCMREDKLLEATIDAVKKRVDAAK